MHCVMWETEFVHPFNNISVRDLRWAANILDFNVES